MLMYGMQFDCVTGLVTSYVRGRALLKLASSVHAVTHAQYAASCHAADADEDSRRCAERHPHAANRIEHQCGYRPVPTTEIRCT